MDLLKQIEDYVREHTWRDKDIFFTSNCLGGELGELQNVIKKEVAYADFPSYREKVQQQWLEGRPTFKEQFTDEAGDVFYYFVQLLNKRGVSLREVIEMQRDKIQKQSQEAGHMYLK